MQEFWAIVEIMGHQQVAGKVSEETIAGSAMLRVDVPEVEGQTAFTKFYASNAIYAITPTEERIARAAASSFRARPVELWRLNLTQPQLVEKIVDDDDIEDVWVDEDDEAFDAFMADGTRVDFTPPELEDEPAPLSDRTKAANWAHNMLTNEKPFVILDTETTGLGDNAEICQIGILSHTGEVLMNQLVKPCEPIPTSSSNIHGITDGMVLDAPTFDAIHEQLCEIIQDRAVVIFNADFDSRIVNQVCRRHGPPEAMNEAASVHCAMLQYAPFRGDWNEYYGNYRWPKLAYAIDEFSIDLGDGKEHDAMTDCRITLELLKGMAKYAQTEPTADYEIIGGRLTRSDEIGDS